ncbi:MAG: hypothetical protein Fur003_2260 [Candidatus Dojkabacteria bacterium]
MKEFKNGLLTGLTLQLAIGPVFFYIINLAIQKGLLDGFAGVIAVTLVDYLYITLSVFGIGKVLEQKKVKKAFGLISSSVLVLYGGLILKGLLEQTVLKTTDINTSNPMTSFLSVFFMTISSPMTIIFFTSIFTSKAVELNYTKKELVRFGLGTGFATFMFMGSSALILSFLGNVIPLIVVQILNGIVGALLIGYGIVRILNLLKASK